jgi:ABC-type phosphate transport system substrate-binding protein
MKNKLIKTFLLGAVVLALGTGSLFAQAGADVIASESVPVTSLDKSALKDIFLGKTAYWEGGQAVTIIVLTDKTDAALQETTGMTAGAFKTFWQRLTFSGRGKQPKEADSVEKLLAMVAETKGAVALVPAGTELKGVKKIEVK